MDAGAAAEKAPAITQLEKPILAEDRPWGTLLLALFALALSAVGNVYLGLSFYGLHQRYRDLLHRVHVPEIA